MTYQFRKGDTIKCVCSGHAFITNGITYKVMFDQDNNEVTIRDNDGDVADYHIRNFELVASFLDFSKPIFTADGEVFTVVSTSLRDPHYPVMGYVGESKSLNSFTAEGKFLRDGSSDSRDLTNTPPKKEAVRYINMYADGSVGGGNYSSRKTADDAYCCAGKTRVACVRVVLTEGQFDN